MRRPPSQRPRSSPPSTPTPPTPPPTKSSSAGGGGASDGLEDMRGTEKSGRGSSGGCGGNTVLTVGQAISSRLRRLLSQPSSTSSAPSNPPHHHHGHRADHQHHHTVTGMPRGSRPDGVADSSAAAAMQQQQCPPEHVPGAAGDVQPAGQQQPQPHYHRKRKERHESLSLSQDRKVIRSSSEERAVVELEVEVAVSEIEVVGKTTEGNGIIRDFMSTDVREQKKTKGSSNGANNNILRRVSSHEDVTTARHNCNNQLHNHIQQHIGKGPIVIIAGKDKDKEKGVKRNGKTFLQELIGEDAPLLAPRSFPQPLHEHNSSTSSNSTINPSPKEEELVVSHSPASTRVGSPSPTGNLPASQGTAVATVSPAVSTPFFFLPTPVGEEEEEHERRRSSERFASFPRASTPRGGKSGGSSRPRESRRPRRQRAAKSWKEVDGDTGGGSSSSKENEEEDSINEENLPMRGDFDKDTQVSVKSHHYPKYSTQLHQAHAELLVPTVVVPQDDDNVPSTEVNSFMQIHPHPSSISADLGEERTAWRSQKEQEKESEVSSEKGSSLSPSSPTSSSSSSSTSPSSSPSTTPESQTPAAVPNLPSPTSVSVPQLDLASLLRRMDTTEEPLTSRGPWGPRAHGGNDDEFLSREMRYFDVSRRAGERDEEEEGHVVPISPRNSMVLTRGGGAMCGTYLDPNVPPSPPTEHHLPHLKRVPDPLASESPASFLTKQVSRQINSLKKKIKRYEEEFEGQFGYRPSHADKLANRDVKKWISELGKLRKDLKQMKEDPHSPMLASAKSLGMSFAMAGRDVQKVDGKPVKMEDTLTEVEKRLTEKRLTAGRPEELEALTREQLQDEKLALQKALLQMESLHGRPSTREERDLVRPLYDRYRMLKRMVIRSGPSKLKDSVTELATIHEHEAMDFTPQAQPEDGADEGRVPALKSETVIGLVPSVAGDVSKEEDRKVPDIGENLHSLPLGDLLGVQREAREEKKRLRRTLREFEEEFALLSGRRATKEERPPALEQTAILYKRTRAKLRLLEALVAKHTGGAVTASTLDE